ncbi:MAG: GAF domain-containing protein, partial [Chloroflexota bacterium]|nr:GAF domain-containing protein [Chloroflexota bacterium]
KPRVFSGDDAHLLSLVANQTLVALERRQAEEEIRRQAARAPALVRVAARLNAHLDLTTVLDAVCEETAHALNVPIATVSLRDKQRNMLRLASAFGLPSEYRERMQVLPLAIYNDYARRFGSVVVVPDVQTLADLPNADLYASMNLRTTASVSMVRKGELIGRLNIGTRAKVREFADDELELLRGLADEAVLAIVNARLFEDNARRFKQVQALRTIDMAITGSLDLRIVLHVLLEQVTAQLGIDAATVLLFHPHSQMLEYAAERGFLTVALQHSQIHLGEGHAGRAALERRIIAISDFQAEISNLQSAIQQEGFVAYYAVPLIAKGQIKGVLEIFHRSALDTDSEWLNFLEALAGQAAIAIDNAGLLDNLQRSHAELALAYDTTLEGWSRALDLRDQETEGHSQRVTEMTLRLARALGMSDADLAQVRRGALLHDIGKMGIPNEILLKPCALTEEEWKIMRKHPVYAYELLLPVAYLRPALDIP